MQQSKNYVEKILEDKECWITACLQLDALPSECFPACSALHEGEMLLSPALFSLQPQKIEAE